MKASSQVKLNLSSAHVAMIVVVAHTNTTLDEWKKNKKKDWNCKLQCGESCAYLQDALACNVLHLHMMMMMQCKVEANLVYCNVKGMNFRLEFILMICAISLPFLCQHTTAAATSTTQNKSHLWWGIKLWDWMATERESKKQTNRISSQLDRTCLSFVETNKKNAQIFLPFNTFFFCFPFFFLCKIRSLSKSSAGGWRGRECFSFLFDESSRLYLNKCNEKKLGHFVLEIEVEKSQNLLITMKSDNLESFLYFLCELHVSTDVADMAKKKVVELSAAAFAKVHQTLQSCNFVVDSSLMDFWFFFPLWWWSIEIDFVNLVSLWHALIFRFALVNHAHQSGTDLCFWKKYENIKFPSDYIVDEFSCFSER